MRLPKLKLIKSRKRGPNHLEKTRKDSWKNKNKLKSKRILNWRPRSKRIMSWWRMLKKLRRQLIKQNKPKKKPVTQQLNYFFKHKWYLRNSKKLLILSKQLNNNSFRPRKPHQEKKIKKMNLPKPAKCSKLTRYNKWRKKRHPRHN